MGYKYSKGSQVIGDLKAADDTQRDTLIDFGQDQIEFQTSGSTRLKVENTQILTTVPLHISGSLTEGLRIAKGNSDYREIQFETDGVDTAFIQVDSSEGLVIGCQSANDEIIFMTTDGSGTNEVVRMTSTGYVGIGDLTPQKHIHITGSHPRVKIDAYPNTWPGIELAETGTRKWALLNDPTDDKFLIKTDANTRMVIEQDGKVGIGIDSPSYKLDIDGDIRIRGNDIRDNSGNKAITFDGSASTTVVNDLTVSGSLFDKNGKSVIKHIDHGAFSNGDSNNNEAFVPDDYIHDYGGSNLFVTFVPPFSGSVDKLVVRGVNNTNLADLGNITATVKIGNQGTNSYNIDTNPDSFESTTVISSNLGAETNATFNFTASNFTPHDVYCVTLKPTNNWDSNGTKYINFTIVTSYIID